VTALQTVVDAAYGDNIQLRHIRCGWATTMVCRPFLDSTGTIEAFDGDGCASGEQRIGNDTYPSLGACENQLNVALYCYHPTSAPAYTMLTVATPSGSCASGDLELTRNYQSGAYSGNPANTYYSSSLLLPHQRCRLAGSPDAYIVRLTMTDPLF
jgi:hypothetical protein